MNEARESTERIIDNLLEKWLGFVGHRIRYDFGRARLNFLSVAIQKKPRRRKNTAAIRRQLEYLKRYLDAIDAIIAFGTRLSDLKTLWWQKLLVISELYR